MTRFFISRRHCLREVFLLIFIFWRTRDFSASYNKMSTRPNTICESQYSGQPCYAPADEIMWVGQSNRVDYPIDPAAAQSKCDAVYGSDWIYADFGGVVTRYADGSLHAEPRCRRRDPNNPNSTSGGYNADPTGCCKGEIQGYGKSCDPQYKPGTPVCHTRMATYCSTNMSDPACQRWYYNYPIVAQNAMTGYCGNKMGDSVCQRWYENSPSIAEPYMESYCSDKMSDSACKRWYENNPVAAGATMTSYCSTRMPNSLCQKWYADMPIAATDAVKTYCANNPSNPICLKWYDDDHESAKEILSTPCSTKMGSDAVCKQWNEKYPEDAATARATFCSANPDDPFCPQPTPPAPTSTESPPQDQVPPNVDPALPTEKDLTPPADGTDGAEEEGLSDNMKIGLAVGGVLFALLIVGVAGAAVYGAKKKRRQYR